MSVTFAIESNPTGQYLAECDLNGELARGDLATVQAAADAHPWEDCPGCLGYHPMVREITDIDGAPEVNLCNANASTLLFTLNLLALEPAAAEGCAVNALLGAQLGELAGHCSGADFLARVLLALAEDRDDEAVPAVQDGRHFSGGRRGGYITDTLHRLRQLSEEAHRLGRPVSWG
jgi:hypothetical protein